MKKIFIIILLLNLFVLIVNGSAPKDCCIRFSPQHTEEELVYYSASTMNSTGWITIIKNGGIHRFIANGAEAESINNDVLFEEVGPADNTYTNAMYWFNGETGNVLCQWDEGDNKIIHEEVAVEGSLLKTPDDNFVSIGNDIFNDIDIYKFTPTKTAYCIEFSSDSDVCLSISKDGSSFTEYTLENSVKGFANSECNKKRAYKIDWIPNVQHYIKIHGSNQNSYYKNRHNYSFTIRKVRPIVLVHGINSHPVRITDHDTAFGKIKQKLGYVNDVIPCYVFDFPWNHDVGLYTKYCTGSSALTLSYYIFDNCSDWDYKPIVFAHSMGGMLVLRQTEDDSLFLNQVDQFIFFATPFCGADKASWVGASRFASSENINCLKRGKKHIWNLLGSMPDGFLDKSLFFYGEDNWMYLVVYGGTFSDSIVSISSANLPKTMHSSASSIGVDYDHSDITEFKFPCKKDYAKMFEQIIPYIGQNQEH